MTVVLSCCAHLKTPGGTLNTTKKFFLPTAHCLPYFFLFLKHLLRLIWAKGMLLMKRVCSLVFKEQQQAFDKHASEEINQRQVFRECVVQGEVILKKHEHTANTPFV